MLQDRLMNVLTVVGKNSCRVIQGGIHIPVGQMRGEGVHEMTMNDHVGEGFRNDHVVRWIEFFRFRSENGFLHEFSILAAQFTNLTF